MRFVSRLKGLPCAAASTMVSGGVLLAFLTVGCGSGRPDVRLPSTSPHGAPVVSASPISDEEQVKQAYTQYWAVLPKAEQAATPDRRRQLLASYATPTFADQVSSNIDKLHAKKLTSAGYVVVHIEKVRIDGDRAKLWDCQDSTHAQLKRMETGQDTGPGIPNDHYRAMLVRETDRRWRISGIAELGRC